MNNDIYCVIVTYGDRYEIVSRVISALEKLELIAKIVLVDNNSNVELTPLYKSSSKLLPIIHNERNFGSAVGFSQGIKCAIEQFADYIFLLDDDNLPKDDCLDVLKNALVSLEANCGLGGGAVCASRPQHNTDLLTDVPECIAFPDQDSFLGFNFNQLPYKIKRLFGLKKKNIKYPKNREIPYAPYGGFLAHSSLYKKIGLPKEDLFLYADDTEYTYRITKLGRPIIFVAQAELVDIDTSWFIEKAPRSAFLKYLLMGSDFRVYYSIRNRIWFENKFRCRWVFIYLVNKYIFLTILMSLSIKCGTLKRFQLIAKAVSDGEAGRLGKIEV